MLGRLATRECRRVGLGLPAVELELIPAPSCWPGPVGVWSGKRGVLAPGPVKGVRIYCFQNSRSSFESRASLPPALSNPPFLNDAINSGVGVGKLRPIPPELPTED